MKRLFLILLMISFTLSSAHQVAAAPNNKAKNTKKKKKTSFSKASKTFEALDKNKDWELSLKELAVAIDPKNAKKAQVLFKQLQSEKDPKSKLRATLNVSEFRNGYEKLKALSTDAKKKPAGKKNKKW